MEILGKRIVGASNKRPIPERVVVADQSSHPHQLHELLVVVQIVVFVRVYEDEVERIVILVLPIPSLQSDELASHRQVNNCFSFHTLYSFLHFLVIVGVGFQQ